MIRDRKAYFAAYYAAHKKEAAMYYASHRKERVVSQAVYRAARKAKRVLKIYLTESVLNTFFRRGLLPEMDFIL
jgi:hypothetical protein